MMTDQIRNPKFEIGNSPPEAQKVLDEHVAEIIDWHFSPETGCRFWLNWAEQQDWDVRKEVRTFADLKRFGRFQDDWLRFEDPRRWVPKPYEGRPYNIFETGGTTGMPKQRIGWDDYKRDYESFGDMLDDNEFPRGKNWLMMGPMGPRRLRLAIEHLANYHGGSCYFIDLDPHWVKKLIANRDVKQARAYMEHVVDPENAERTVDYGPWGRVELTTLTKEFFMPRFLERDEAIRRKPIDGYPWDGVGEVRPFGASAETIFEGVYYDG